jgi:hypothetical protein
MSRCASIREHALTTEYFHDVKAAAKSFIKLGLEPGHGVRVLLARL